MEFISTYAMFLAKVATVAVAVMAVMLLGAALAARNTQRGHKGRLVVTKLNERFEHLADTLRDQMMNAKAAKLYYKKRKKADRTEAKQLAKHESKQASAPAVKKRVYVLDFDGDIKASATSGLRQCITAILALAEPTDEVVVRLESAGGMVHSYGLAASQLFGFVGRFRGAAHALQRRAFHRAARRRYAQSVRVCKH